MARRFPILAVATLAVAACYALEEGRQQSWTLQTHHTGVDVKPRATTHLSRAGYQVLHADDRLIEAEKRRDTGSFDVLRVIVEGSSADGARVRVQALSEEGSGGGRAESRGVSTTALADGQALVAALTKRPAGP